mmetsp:Transcript_21089/g.53427  ORF Transcript_21089/g.53427 Transcript_21089/m.53427 type:complete len:203 (+) Transcript_21089:895-1503(+)
MASSACASGCARACPSSESHTPGRICVEAAAAAGALPGARTGAAAGVLAAAVAVAAATGWAAGMCVPVGAVAVGIAGPPESDRSPGPSSPFLGLLAISPSTSPSSGLFPPPGLLTCASGLANPLTSRQLQPLRCLPMSRHPFRSTRRSAGSVHKGPPMWRSCGLRERSMEASLQSAPWLSCGVRDPVLGPFSSESAPLRSGT